MSDRTRQQIKGGIAEQHPLWLRVQALAEEGSTDKQIGEALGLDLPKVKYIRRRLRVFGIAEPHNRGKSGTRKRLQNAAAIAEKAAIVDAAARSGIAPEEITRMRALRNQRGLSVSSLVKVTGFTAEKICAALGLEPAFARR